MILLHRISSFVITIVAALGFTALISTWGNPVLIMMLTSLLVALIFARLCGWHVRTFQFWHLTGTPFLFLTASYGPFLLLESQYAKIALAVIVVIFLFIFAEQVFSFLHLPINYQAFTLEHLSQLLHVISVFFLATFGFGLSVFLQMPIWILSIAFFGILFFIVYGMLWVGKVDHERAKPFAFAGALLTTQLFTVLSFLPVGFYTNAAYLALGVYVFLGIARAHAHHKLSKKVLQRYLIIFLVLAVAISITSQWV